MGVLIAQALTALLELMLLASMLLLLAVQAIGRRYQLARLRVVITQTFTDMFPTDCLILPVIDRRQISPSRAPPDDSQDRCD